MINQFYNTATIAEGGTFYQNVDPVDQGLLIPGMSVNITWSTSSGTATSGSDFTAAQGSADITYNGSGYTITVPVAADGKAESAETFTFTWTYVVTVDGSPEATTGFTETYTITIPANSGTGGGGSTVEDWTSPTYEPEEIGSDRSGFFTDLAEIAHGSVKLLIRDGAQKLGLGGLYNALADSAAMGAALVRLDANLIDALQNQLSGGPDSHGQIDSAYGDFRNDVGEHFATKGLRSLFEGVGFSVQERNSFVVVAHAIDAPIVGSAKRDAIFGGSLDNKINGGDGDDFIGGGDGKDKIKGGKGDDYSLNGGAGKDWLQGGKGKDSFAFYAGDEKDIIKDFKVKNESIALQQELASGFSDIKNAAKEYKAGVKLDFGKDELWLEGVKIEQLKKVDFEFI